MPTKKHAAKAAPAKVRNWDKHLTTHDGRDGNVIVDEIAPGPRDRVVRQDKPPGFFGTRLLSYLQNLGCDAVIVTGTRR